MNYALVKEVEIAGVQIWKAIEDINRVYLTKENQYLVVDYLFTSLYQAAQGIERLLKVTIELLVYGEDKYDKEKVNELLYGHNHVAMVEYLTNEKKLSLKTREKRLVQLLYKFYDSARYNRYSYSEDDTLELTLIREFAKDIKEDDDYNKKVKHMYGRALGIMSRELYGFIRELSFQHQIYVVTVQNPLIRK